MPVPDGARLYSPGDLQSQGASREPQPFEFKGKVYRPGANAHWKPNYPEGLDRLAAADRIHVAANSLRYRRFASDFPYKERGNLWTDTLTGSFTDEKMYVVQTNPKVELDDSVWVHLSGAASAPVGPGEHGQIAVKVVDDRGNELMVVKSLSDA